ncbi:MAG: hypothetical protein AB1728_14600 [Bacteroidota bacterium]
MNRLCVLLVAIAAMLPAQEASSLRLLEYRVEAAIDEQQAEVSGTAAIWIQINNDKTDQIQFRVPANLDVNAVRDIDDDKFSLHSVQDGSGFFVHTISLPSRRIAGDSVFVKIEFEEVFDTSSYSTQFINNREFLLLSESNAAWLPQFAASPVSRVSLTLTVPQSFRPGTAQFTVTSIDEEKNVWRAERTLTALRDFFTICGSTSIVELKNQSADSLTSISLFVDTTRFNPGFADSLLTYLMDAASFFKSYTATQSIRCVQTFSYIGSPRADKQLIRTRECTIDRYSPAYEVFDSSVFVQSMNNVWLVALARQFSLSRSDSTAFFDDGLAGYLATTFINTQFPHRERNERLDLLINTLSFFPTSPLAAGRTQQKSDDENLSNKGRYVFLMLEYLFGNESFAAVVKKMYNRFLKEEITVRAFQRLCEEEYGSPLDWFFQEWLHRSTAPEFSVQWKTERTQRGVSLTKVTIEQRGDVFTMPVTIVFTIGSKKIPRRLLVEQLRQEFSFTFNAHPTSVEIDPDLSILRWLLDIRILAHARSSLLFCVYNRDISSAKREAQLTLDLDPVNTTGSAPIAYFSLGKLAVLEKNLDRAKEYFLKAMQAKPSEESSLYPLLSLIRYGNILEMEGNRAEAIPLYQRAVSEGKRSPSLFAPAIIEAEKYLREQFISSDELWYGIY